IPGSALTMGISRRTFLKGSSALTARALAASLGSFGVESARAQAVGDYKALVCVFLFGGNDSNNMVVPVDDYAQYAAVRTTASNVALTAAEILPFSAARQGGRKYGFHPSFATVAPLYASGNLAVIANAGTLIAPITK